jgi:lipopolysaccharide transport system ATP-binding protein
MSSTSTVIHGEGLGKRYRRGLQVDYGLRHSLEAFLRSPIASLRRKKEEMFWALKDVSLEVKEGEVLGLIGRNGAGKTTLLKILSRITRPTEGWAEIHGRVGSLLEVGTGFHPELTGRENTFLSGAILGMGKAEIERKFDEIVAFAELEKFIDTPVKHYSSGMYVRLAFAVAAHLEPEILLVDEVLAVGDINFQKKCMGKMGDVARVGRTVILVSHNLGAIGQLCHRTISIEQGIITADGPTETTIANYLRSVVGTPNDQSWERTGTGRVKFQSIEVCEEGGEPCAHAQMGKDFYVRVAGSALKPETEFTLAFQLVSLNGTVVVWIYDQFKTFRPNLAGEFLIEARIPQLMLMPGSYFVHAWLGRPSQEEFDYVKNATSFEVVQSERIPVTIGVQNHLGLTYAPLYAKQLK